jgi:AcrR family transcriptional regulator
LHRHNLPVKKNSYHHGDLANSLVSAAVSLLETRGVDQLSLREVARVAGVSHGAPAHHFGDKAGLLTAVAIEGYRLLAEALLASQARPNRSSEQRLLDAGQAYIRFALSRPAYFEVMFRPALTHSHDPEYLAAALAPQQILGDSIRRFLLEKSPRSPVPEQQVQTTLLALWSQVHGFASLWLAGNLGDTADQEQLESIVSAVLGSITPRI